MQSLTINLEGKSYIPQISLIEPVSENESTPVIDFDMVLNHESSEKFLKIQNVGLVMAEVTVDFADNLENLFSIYLVSNEPCGCVSEKIGNIKTFFLLLIY